MSQHKGVDVRIVNPAAGRGYTSRKCAERYVRRGVARWIKDKSGRECLEFLSGGAVARSVVRETAYDRAAHTGLATLSELSHLPMIAPARVMGFGRNKGASRHTFLSLEPKRFPQITA